MATTTTGSRAPDMGQAQLPILKYIEPVIIVGAITATLIMSRRRNFNIIPDSSDKPLHRRGPNESSRSSEDTLVDLGEDDYASESDDSLLLQPVEHHPKRHSSLQNSARYSGRFSQNIHGRILQKFPFLLEMFYVTLNFLAYKFSKQAAASFHGQKGNEVIQLAQDHGISILHFEHQSIFSFFFAIKEITVQRFFLEDHVTLMSVLNQVYSLVHIPGTVSFICWYYYAAQTHEHFAIARRTLTLGNFVAFVVFAVYPCMPPRLLPKRFGFKDTVRQAHAESIWVGKDGKSENFNQLAAMPSLHFTYALVIGCTLFYHSGFLQSLRSKRLRERGFPSLAMFMLAGVFYPALVLLVIVATANHYYLDAVVAAFSVVLCFFCNRVWLCLLPAERLLALILRVEKPIPTTGENRKGKENRSTALMEEEEESFV